MQKKLKNQTLVDDYLYLKKNATPEPIVFRLENSECRFNPVPTFEVSLGMYVLWTIESTRLKSIENGSMVHGFPSQNPVIKKRDNFEFIEQNTQLQHEVADSYFGWWESNKNKDFAEFHQIDPLADTKYRWH